MTDSSNGPDYACNDLRGWCGDPRRGAAMGRASTHADDKRAPVKLYLRRVRLNGDYDSNGTYFGAGEPLFWCASEDNAIDYMLRARDRNHAKRLVLADYPAARFFDGTPDTTEPGVPNLDGMSIDALMAFWFRYSRPSRRDAERLIGDRRRGFTSIAGALAGYASNKATAMRCRLNGDIQGATVYETIADGIYAELPEDLRW